MIQESYLEMEEIKTFMRTTKNSKDIRPIKLEIAKSHSPNDRIGSSQGVGGGGGTRVSSMDR